MDKEEKEAWIEACELFKESLHHDTFQLVKEIADERKAEEEETPPMTFRYGRASRVRASAEPRRESSSTQPLLPLPAGVDDVEPLMGVEMHEKAALDTIYELGTVTSCIN